MQAGEYEVDGGDADGQAEEVDGGDAGEDEEVRVPWAGEGGLEEGGAGEHGGGWPGVGE